MNTSTVDLLDAMRPGFRFLYGRWILYTPPATREYEKRSDSSMVDEYVTDGPACPLLSGFRFLYGRWIPISWITTIWARQFRFLYGRWIQRHSGTHKPRHDMFRFLYGRWILCCSGLWPACTLRSDSSMVDEYPPKTRSRQYRTLFRFLYGRWIHTPVLQTGNPLYSSDSSMVDEYSNANVFKFNNDWFRFLYGRWIRNSSKGDRLFEEVQIPLWSMNTGHLVWNRLVIFVQIPLWSMNTSSCATLSPAGSFRFLYGRWIRPRKRWSRSWCKVQIPLWSMNTLHLPPCRIMPDMFRFLYGRWILYSAVRSIAI